MRCISHLHIRLTDRIREQARSHQKQMRSKPINRALTRIFFLSRQAVTVRPTKPKPPGSDLT
ncbi:hypothetical protein C0J26_11950 [Pseudomonas baetica]|nr:hypothetical protein C0J26_11950 [Pseudomonas baetica]